MLFNSYIFIFLFLPLTIFAYFGLNKLKLNKAARFSLVIASLFFYGYNNPSYLLIILSSIVLNYLFGKIIRRSNLKGKNISQIVMIIAIILNIGILFYFKYFDFLIYNINMITTADFNYLNLALPLGISFFTFQQLSYVIDSYKNEIPDYDFFSYSLFVSFFPQLVAGPIVLHSEVIPQFEDPNNHKINSTNLAKGIQAFSIGLAKKVLIADNFGKIVDYGYIHISSLNSVEAILTVLAYTMQIYFDFSGYCDMATGIGLMFNISLPQNFNSPYKATNINDFWKRWHITLTRFLTNYIYIPLGGNRKGILRTYINIFIVFLASGIWHGAGYTFILWGILHGVAQILTRIFKKQIDKIPSVILWPINFLFLNVTWVYFRATSVSDAHLLFSRIFKGGFGVINAELTETLLQPVFISAPSQLIPFMVVICMYFIMAGLIAVAGNNTNQIIKNTKLAFSSWIATYVLLLCSILSLSGVSSFLYFNF